MSLTGIEKSRILLSMLGAEAQRILTELSPETAHLLTHNITDAPKIDAQTQKELLSNVINRAQDLLQEEESESQTEEPEIVEPEPEFVPEPEPELDSSSPLESEPEILPEEEPIVEPVIEKPSLDFEHIVQVLSDQKPAITAFVLSKLTDDIKSEILSRLPSDIVNKIQSTELKAVPGSEKIFNRIYNDLFSSVK